MYKAVRAFIRYGRYPESRPHRWRALGVQSAYTVASVFAFILLTPIFLLMVLTWPFAWLHEVLRERRFWLPTDPVAAWHSRELRRLNPIFLNACEAAGHEPDGSPRRMVTRSDGEPTRPLPHVKWGDNW